MPFTYSSEFRAMIVDQLRADRSVAEVSAELGINESTLYRWKKQDRGDRGLEPGTPTAESADLR